MYISKFDNIADVLLLLYFKELFIGSFCLQLFTLSRSQDYLRIYIVKYNLCQLKFNLGQV